MTRFTADSLRKLPKSKVDELFKQLGPQKVEELKHTWTFWARDEQLEPEGNWNTWFINAVVVSVIPVQVLSGSGRRLSRELSVLLL